VINLIADLNFLQTAKFTHKKKSRPVVAPAGVRDKNAKRSYVYGDIILGPDAAGKGERTEGDVN